MIIGDLYTIINNGDALVIVGVVTKVSGPWIEGYEIFVTRRDGRMTMVHLATRRMDSADLVRLVPAAQPAQPTMAELAAMAERAGMAPLGPGGDSDDPCPGIEEIEPEPSPAAAIPEERL